MDIKPYDKTIRDLLGSKRQFVIPRFQREYSWDQKNYQEFLEDMLGNLQISDKKISWSHYFLGTMLFIGNFAEGTEQQILVVDGQQRLTTITILFSALSDIFIELNQDKLSTQVFSYIMTEDDNGNEVRVLKTKSSYPYFSYFIQDKSKSIHQDAATEEEESIQSTYHFFEKQLSEKNLKKFLCKKNNTKTLEDISYVDILKALRDQVLNSTFVSISTTAQDQANKIFEILNAKGKRLAHIDLIKNKIFETLNQTEPADFAEESWANLGKILNEGDERIGLATFYQHYWSSTYSKVSSNMLYDKFSSILSSQIDAKEFCKQLLNNLLKSAKIYMQVVNPKRDYFKNKKEYYGVVQSLKVISDTFNIVQARIALLSLLKAKENGNIDLKNLKKAIFSIENFHFAYTAILSGRANRLEKIYSSFAIKLQRAKNKSEGIKIVNDSLINELNSIFPSFDEFCKKFMELTFSKKDNSTNIKTKYALSKINSYFLKKEIFTDDSSVEHILPEGECAQSLNIGNLILLEMQLNNEAGNKNYIQKKDTYKKSQYPWVKNFINDHQEWDATQINIRARFLAKLYYEKIFSRSIENE